MKILTVSQMIAAEKAADAAGIAYAAMMETAGRGVAEAALEHVATAKELRVLLLVGPGNNGGDGLVAARYLAEAGADVAVYLYKSRDPATDENFKRVQQMALFVVEADFDPRYRVLRTRLQRSDLVIDALLGTGVSRPIGGNLAKLMGQVKEGITQREKDAEGNGRFLTPITQPAQTSVPRTKPNLTIVAVDCPSGLNCDTGALDKLAIPADLTVTFAGPKRGHFMFPGAAACGELVVVDINIPPELPEIKEIRVEVATAVSAQALLPLRPLDGHKGTFGTALIVAGSARYWGAPVLAARAAYRAGAGLVALAVPGAIRAAAATQLPEATFPVVHAQEMFDGESVAQVLETAVSAKALLVGPGLGMATEFIIALIAAKEQLPPLVVDADGLNILATLPNWPQRLPPNSILTPHPGEMARLMAVPIAEVKQTDRVALAQRMAAEWGQIVLLKGAYTVVAAPNDYCTILPFANPVLGVAGSGDVLSGVIVSLLAQGLQPFDAAVLGGYLHGFAGQLAANTGGAVGALAGDFAEWVKEARNRLNELT